MFLSSRDACKLNCKLFSSGKVLSKSRNINTLQGLDILYDKLIFFIVQDYKKDKMDVNVSIAF